PPFFLLSSSFLPPFFLLSSSFLLEDEAVQGVARRRGLTPAQVALAWVLSREGVMAIPKAARESHQRENLAAAELVLDGADLRVLESAHPAPVRKQPLAML
ncbi:MAG: aldo/keto reductase, partial [Rhizobacter sp.]